MGSEKVKRLGGPKYIKSRARDRKLKEWVEWVFWRIGFITFLIYFYFLYPFIIYPSKRYWLGLPHYIPVLDEIINVVTTLISDL